MIKVGIINDDISYKQNGSITLHTFVIFHVVRQDKKQNNKQYNKPIAQSSARVI